MPFEPATLGKGAFEALKKQEKYYSTFFSNPTDRAPLAYWIVVGEKQIKP